MAVLKRRTRMVNFRLSEEEYEYLKKVCLTEGARSISDFARAAVCRSMAATGARKEETEVLVHILDGKVGELDREVKQLAEQMQAAQRSRRRKRIEPLESIGS